MPDLVIIDTDILIDAGRRVPEAIACLREVEARSSLAISSITQMELIVGCRNRTDLRATERFLERFRIVKLDERVADIAVDLLRRYRLSHGLLIADALIGATAIAAAKPLVTKNQRDYRFMTDLQLLKYPDPFTA
ncbi:MAG: type II toxin-antitoxin system VapC family toxin [Chloroflexi bacterium]|nr:type II toxin-antitoxin system VapC family toxin [Chloroflexota bacterium]